MTLVVDASVAVKWVVDEPLTPQALALIDGGPLIAPDFLLLECANVLAREVRRGKLASEFAQEAYATLESMPVRQLPTAAHIGSAQQIALELQQTTYDCVYLALALSAGATLVTADKRFATAASRSYPNAIRLLS